MIRVILIKISSHIKGTVIASTFNSNLKTARSLTARSTHSSSPPATASSAITAACDTLQILHAQLSTAVGHAENDLIAEKHLFFQ